MEKSGEEFFFSWPAAFQAGVEAAGGKGWNLGRLERYGFKIPAGGVLLAGAYQYFIEENNLREATKEIAQSLTIGNIGEKETEEKLFLIREKIKAGLISPHIQEEMITKLKYTGILEKPVAVRSSATAEDASGASFAGIHESFLNVLGLDNILSAIKACYASLWTTRAVAYRQKMKIRDNEVIQAVVILEMVDAVASGIGFTCDPRTGRQDVLVINANYGLGECVVGGIVDPDEYCLDFNPKYALPKIIKKRIGRKEGKTVAKADGGTTFVKSPESAPEQVLSDENMKRLSLLISRVYAALGQGEQHQDIEWVFDGKDFILVQARPVTVMPRYTYSEIKNQPDIWDNTGYKESNSMVQSNLNWCLSKNSLDTLIEASFKAIGYPLLTGMQYHRLFQGRVYGNLAAIQWIYYDVFGLTPRELSITFGQRTAIENLNENPFKGISGCSRIFNSLKFLFVMAKIKMNASKFFEMVGGYVEVWLRKGFQNVNDKEFINIYNDMAQKNEEASTVFSMMMGAASFHIRILIQKLDKVFPGKGNAVTNALMVGGADITSAQHGYRLTEMAEIARSDTDAQRFFSVEPFNPLLWETEIPDKSPFKQSFHTFLAEYGHRGIHELDIINPRWREDPSYLLDTIRSTLNTADINKIKARQKEIGDKSWREFNQKLPFYRRFTIKYRVRQAQKGAELREMSKSVLVKTFEPFRMMALEIGRRFEVKGIIEKQSDIFHCAWPELFSVLSGDWDGKGLDILVAERKVRRNDLQKLSPPGLIVGEVPQLTEPVTCKKGNTLNGIGVAAGRASGKAKLIYHPNEGGKLKNGDVLVAPLTDPAWTPLFLRVAAVVMETGGIISHGAIVAREYGIPAVTNIPGLMEIIKDDQEIIVDGDEGKVFLLRCL